MDKILVVDDDSKNRMIVINALEQTQQAYEVFSATDGQMAVVITEDILPDVILMDWEMPKMNGLEALRELKKRPATMNIPVIMYTGIMTETESLQKALELGAIDFLRKPIETIELLARIKATLNYQKSIAARLQAERDKAALIKEIKDQEIKHKTKELTNLAVQMESSNNFLAQIRMELHKLVATAAGSKLQKIIKNIDLKIDSEEDWQQLQDRIDSIHIGFLVRLANACPTLTRNELKLCVFLRLGISRAEIANVLQKSVETIKKSRSRIRKKLALPTEIQLEDHLAMI